MDSETRSIQTRSRSLREFLLYLAFIGILFGFHRTLRLQNEVLNGVAIQFDSIENHSTGVRQQIANGTLIQLPNSKTRSTSWQERPNFLHLNSDRTVLHDGMITSAHNSTGPVRKWAYAFLIGGCGSNKPEYRGFLYNIFVATHKLRELGTKADVIVYVQMSTLTHETKLPDNETRVLDFLGVRTIYLPKVSGVVHEVFYALVKEKFRILNATEYSRVLFLDGDIMPLCSLDYLFELSEPELGEPTLKENVVLSLRREAANAGFFMLHPNSQDFTKLLKVIRTKEEKALRMPFPHWDPVEGWGHKITKPDFWRTQDGMRGRNWTWHAVFADQGLLYHWTKYEKQSVSLIIADEVENWTSKNGTAQLERTLKGILKNYTCLPFPPEEANSPSPYMDFVHFSGDKKPWVVPRANDRDNPVRKTVGEWFRILRIIGNQTNMILEINATDKKPPVGKFSDYKHMIKHIRARAWKNWTHYTLDSIR